MLFYLLFYSFLLPCYNDQQETEKEEIHGDRDQESRMVEQRMRDVNNSLVNGKQAGVLMIQQTEGAEI